MVTAEQVTAALKKLGPSSPIAIANSVGADAAVVGYRLRAMLEEKALIASGKGRGRVYGLPDQKLEGAGTPPQPRKSPKKPKSKRKGKGKTPKARSAKTAASPAGDFTTALTADNRLVLVDGAKAAQIFSEAQTVEIADVICTAFKA